MKTIIRKLTLCAMLGAAMSAQGAIQFVPNGDFSSGGANWAFDQANGHTVDYPATGGNTGGHAMINGLAASQTWYAVLIANGNTPMSLGSLGLQAGKRYKFLIDMKRFAGANIGGLKLDFSPSGTTGDTFKPLIGDGSTWETYEFQFDIPVGVTGLKVVPLWGANSQVGYDNVRYDNTPVPIIPVVPNGDFEAGGTNWATETTGPTISFPATGGNNDGHAVINASVTNGFAAIKAFSGIEKTFASLGLSAGDICTVQMDMKILQGTNIGGLRVVGPEGYEFLNRPTIIGDGSTWETYSIPFTVPTIPTQAMFSLVWGFDSSVAFDNVKILLPAPPPPVSATIEKGTVVGWTVSNPAYTYQPQKRDNVNDEWTDIGGPVPGTSVPFVFEETASNFYQVTETVPGAPENGVTNPGFENSAADIEPWTIAPQISGATATSVASYLTYTPVSGSRMLKLEAENLANPVPPAEVGVRSNLIQVTAGTPYTVNFSGAVPELGVSFVVGCKVLYFNGFGSAGNSAETTFSANSWTPLAVAFTPPSGVTSVQVNFVLRGGAVPNVKSVCLIDNVVLTVPGAPITNDLVATSGPGVEISWNTITGRTYQVRSSGNLVDWTNFGSSVVGNGSIFSVADPITPGKKFYKVAETP